MARAGPRTVVFMARGWSRSRSGTDTTAGRGATESHEVEFRPSVGLAAQVLLDEVLISALRDPRLYPKGDDYRLAGDEIRKAYDLWSREGWLSDPESYHKEPPEPAGWATRREWSLRQPYETVSFPSAYAPRPDEPGRERWLAHQANRTAYAYVVRHPEPGRPWLVCVHGFGTGRAPVDLRAFRAHHLTRELGLNLLLPVLAMHGPRQEPGSNVGEGFMSINLVDSVHGLAQSACDVRSAIRWVRASAGDVPIGIYGISLGGYVAALTASLEEGLACVIAGVPATDMADLYRRHSSPGVRQRALEAGALGPMADAVTSVVSPLVLEPKPPRHRRYVFAGIGDRMANFDQAHRLWTHWGTPRMTWYPGGHVGFFWDSGVSAFVDDALVESGLAPGCRRLASPGP